MRPSGGERFLQVGTRKGEGGGGPLPEAHRLLHYSTLGSRVMKKKKVEGVGTLAAPRRARIQGSYTFLSPNSRLESNEEEEGGGVGTSARG